MELLKRIEQYAKNEPQAVALCIDDISITYDELWTKVNQAMVMLPDTCVACDVALSFEKVETFVVAYLALLRKGATPCVMDPHWGAQRCEALYKKYDIAYIWDDTGLQVTTYQGVSHECSHLLHIGFTSGTTGLPKAFYRDEASWIASFEENERLLAKHVIAQCPTMAALGPYAHSLTLYVLVYALFYGRTFIGQNNYDVQQCQHVIERLARPCSLFLVPTMVHDWVQGLTSNAYIAYMFVTGDKLSSQLHEKLKIKLPTTTVYEFFGTSEASFISVNRNQTAPLQSVGHLFPSVNVKIDQPNAQGIGMLMVKSPMTFSGYVGDVLPEWIETGDYASVEGDILYLHGRIQDRMIIGGKNISLFTIEQALKTITGIDEVIVIRQQHQKFGELALALYEGDTQLTYRVVREQLEDVLSRYELPSKLICVPKLPRTSSGKVSRRAAQLLYEQGAWQ
ncbi:AMP-binding protein [Staphylococcus americanisciuri]|uniref:Putative long chain fatty acid-CoA ligase VraA n=1 Tax=Staphylococcus americanisciuri TaxID=2973940 RepID=A0ABT2F267_9STAP|nr:AMP-binding protein [Staphylococcus americanisciuri]MCS4486548.1 AMP-binding protein [Staphylococcus americanisciuri]